MQKIDGKEVAQKIKQSVKEQTKSEYLDGGKCPPCLACVLVGNDPASQIYVNSKERACKELGLDSRVYRLDEDSSFEDVKKLIMSLNNDSQVSGILLQLPLPKHLKQYEDALVNSISPRKDVDGLTNANLGKLFSDKSLIAPCTASGIVKLLKNYNIPMQGKKIVVVGRSLLVGKSVAMLLLKENATVEICHSRTENLKEETSKADILIVAVGKPEFITEDMIKKDAVVIDAGINRVEREVVNSQTNLLEKKSVIVGDVDYKNACEKCSFITPVPGGVGPMTIAELMSNTLILHREMQKNANKNTEIEK